MGVRLLEQGYLLSKQLSGQLSVRQNPDDSIVSKAIPVASFHTVASRAHQVLSRNRTKASTFYESRTQSVYSDQEEKLLERVGILNTLSFIALHESMPLLMWWNPGGYSKLAAVWGALLACI